MSGNITEEMKKLVRSGKEEGYINFRVRQNN